MIAEITGHDLFGVALLILLGFVFRWMLKETQTQHRDRSRFDEDDSWKWQ